MNEEDFAKSGFMTPFDHWIDYSNAVLELAGAIYNTFTTIVDADNFLGAAAQSQMGSHHDTVIEIARRSVDGDYPTLHSLVLLAAWGTFETLVEDVCENVLRMEPHRLLDPLFAKATNKANGQNLQEPNRSNRIVESTLSKVRQECNSTGQSRFEAQLEVVDLGDTVPAGIADAIAKARALRNLWAHSNGIADDQFIQDYPGGNYAVGDKIPISRVECARYVLAMNTYAYIIIARYRIRNGLPPVKCQQGGNPFMHEFDQIYPNAVKPESLLN